MKKNITLLNNKYVLRAGFYAFLASSSPLSASKSVDYYGSMPLMPLTYIGSSDEGNDEVIFKKKVTSPQIITPKEKEEYYGSMPLMPLAYIGPSDEGNDEVIFKKEVTSPQIIKPKKETFKFNLKASAFKPKFKFNTKVKAFKPKKEKCFINTKSFPYLDQKNTPKLIKGLENILSSKKNNNQQFFYNIFIDIQKIVYDHMYYSTKPFFYNVLADQKKTNITLWAHPLGGDIEGFHKILKGQLFILLKYIYINSVSNYKDTLFVTEDKQTLIQKVQIKKKAFFMTYKLIYKRGRERWAFEAIKKKLSGLGEKDTRIACDLKTLKLNDKWLPFSKRGKERMFEKIKYNEEILYMPRLDFENFCVSYTKLKVKNGVYSENFEIFEGEKYHKKPLIEFNRYVFSHFILIYIVSKFMF